MRKYLVSLVAIFSFGTATANATVYNPAKPFDTLSDSVGSGADAAVVNYLVSPGSFLYSLNFTVAPGASVLSGSLTSLELPNTFGLFDLTGVLYSGFLGTSSSAAPIVFSPGHSFSVPISSGGAYHVNFSGLTNPTAAGGGFFTAALSTASTAPVPEPETYLMLLSGLCLIGTIAKRRRAAS